MSENPHTWRRLPWAKAVLAALIAMLCSPAQAVQPDRFAELPARVQPFVGQGEISGAVMLVADRHRVLHLSAVGSSDLATGRPMKPDDIFWIASMSKPVTAIAVAMLADDGKLSFDDAVEKYLPEFKDQWVERDSASVQPNGQSIRVLVRADRPITLRDLLTHTSGVAEYPITSPHWTLSEMTKVIAREPLRHQPGARWTYSTAGTDALGRVVEVVSGQSFDRFLQTRLFDPLGMKDTSFWLTPSQLKRWARSYKPGADAGRLVDAPIHYMYGGAVTDRARPPLGGAGLFSTAQDVARVYQMMLNEGVWRGRQLLKPDTVAALTRKHTGNLVSRPGMPWGLGFSVIEDPSRMEANSSYSPGTFGHGGAFGTSSWADPKAGIVRVFMIQRDKMVPSNPDNSPMRRAYESAVAAGLER